MHGTIKMFRNSCVCCLLPLFILSSCVASPSAKRFPPSPGESEEIEVLLPSDQTRLTEIALTSPEWKVREKAVRLVTRQEVLARVALNDSAWTVRETAMNFITDQNLLAKVATTTSDWKVREIAFKNLQDQELLTQIARNVLEDPAVRSLAIDKITNSDVFSDLGIADPVPPIRVAALWKIKNQEVLTRIAQGDTNDNVRKEATKALLTLEGTSTDKEAVQIKMLLIDPDIHAHYGALRLDYQLVNKIEEYLPDENRYSLASRQKISVKMEYKIIIIANKYKHVIYEKVYKTPVGIVSGKVDADIYDSLLGRRYDSTVDLSEICYFLIKSFDNENLLLLLNSKSDCLKTAASIRLEDN